MMAQYTALKAPALRAAPSPLHSRLRLATIAPPPPCRAGSIGATQRLARPLVCRPEPRRPGTPLAGAAGAFGAPRGNTIFILEMIHPISEYK